MTRKAQVVGGDSGIARRVTVGDLRTEYQSHPLGIDTVNPRLSWRLRSQMRGTKQTAYQVRVASSPEDLHRGADLLWDSGRIASEESILRPYAGPPLQSRQRCYWQVRVWNEENIASDWSELQWWEMGLLSKADWVAQWIAPPIDPEPTKATPAPLLRSTFELRGRISRARAYVTSLGLYELHLNGERVGDALFTPGWTSFEKRLQYQVYDVAALLKEGANAVGAVLGDGWYRRVSFQKNQHRNNGKPFALLLQIEVTYDDGRTQQIMSDAAWKTAIGPILMSEIYNGETYDARLEHEGWTRAGYDDRDWTRVDPASPPASQLIATGSPPVRRIEEIVPVRIFKTPAGAALVDMGQNMAGWLRLRVKGEAGTTVMLRHAEVLDRDGNLYTENLTTAQQTIRYTLKGGDEEIFEPHFTYQGFRYVEVQGYPGELRPESLTGVVIHSDIERTGTLETSNALINQLQHNIVWTLKSNAIDIPTDNPQRGERLGWCWEASSTCSTGVLNMNVAAFFIKWLGDLAADQLENGSVPVEIPRARWTKLALNALYGIGGRESTDTRVVEFAGAPGWADAATLVPWSLYLAYEDVRILQDQYESMRRWVEYERSEAGEDHIWKAALNFGDWADVETTRTPMWFGSNDHDLMATAFYGHSVDILRRTAEILGKKEDHVRYTQLFENIREAFCKRFVRDDGLIGTGFQVDYVLALGFDLLPETLRPLGARKLVEDLRARGHLMTGVIGTRYLLSVLSRFGYDEEAYMLLNRTEPPSWLYSVMKGATTLWERWDSVKPDGTFANPGMNSLNQIPLGAIGEWLYGVMAGIALDPESPGYKHILIRPRPGGGLTHANASRITPYGEVATSWRIDRDDFHLDVVIPPNSTATVTLPGARLDEVLEGGQQVTVALGIREARRSGADAMLEISSGRYEFKYKNPFA